MRFQHWDYSRLVLVAAVAAERGLTEKRLGGTITFVDTLGNADETEFADAVIARYGLKNERIVDDWPWRDDGESPPTTSQPVRDYPFYARDRHMVRMLARAGGTTLLTALGPDHLFPIRTAHIPDLVWKGQLRSAARELYRWTFLTRRSVWYTAFSRVLLPLLTQHDYSYVRPARWCKPRLVAAIRSQSAFAYDRTRQSLRGCFVRASDAHALARLAVWMSTWFHLPGIRLRHPFLNRPIVEFCLRLPVGMRTDFWNPKPLLRTAVKGVLPQTVRLRSTKAVLVPRLCWAMGRERQKLATLLSHSVLADYGMIEPRQLLRAVEAGATGLGNDPALLYSVLSLETWLAVRSGRCITGNPGSLTQVR